MMYLNFSESEDTLLTFWHILIRQQLHIFHDIKDLFLSCIFFDVQENEYILLHTHDCIYTGIRRTCKLRSLREKTHTISIIYTMFVLNAIRLFQMFDTSSFFNELTHIYETNIVDMQAKKKKKSWDFIRIMHAQLMHLSN